MSIFSKVGSIFSGTARTQKPASKSALTGTVMRRPTEKELEKSAKIVEQDYGQTEYWDPKYPEFEYEHSPREAGRLSEGGPEWTMAPAGSHVLSFRFFDARERNVVIQGGRTIGNSRIQVRFKPSGKRGVTEYDYFFPDPIIAESIFRMLCSTDHPGEIVHGVLIANQVPYNRRA